MKTLSVLRMHNINDALRMCIFVLYFRKNSSESLQAVCSDLLELFASCKITQAVEDRIMSELSSLLGDTYNQVSLAVRSSAAGKQMPLNFVKYYIILGESS